MQRKDVEFEHLYDIRAVRILVADVGTCYAALGIVHALWPPIPSEFDDYIARPKGNEYRSLHTAVMGIEGKTLEVQIRTHEMHSHAELGVAAHWKYKEGSEGRRRVRAQGRVDAPAARPQARRRGRRRADGGPARGARRRPRLSAHAAGRGARPAARRDRARLRVPRAHRGRPPLPRREGQRAHRHAEHTSRSRATRSRS